MAATQREEPIGTTEHAENHGKGIGILMRFSVSFRASRGSTPVCWIAGIAVIRRGWAGERPPALSEGVSQADEFLDVERLRPERAAESQ